MWQFGRGYVDEYENVYPYYVAFEYAKETKTWAAKLIFSPSVPDDLWTAADENIEIICDPVTHKLSGTIALVVPGWLGASLCPNCTAQVTL